MAKKSVFIIRNGTVVTSERVEVVDLLCVGETIRAIGPNLSLSDARGALGRVGVVDLADSSGGLEAGENDEGFDLLEACESFEEIDATGKLVFPGGIDPHTHFYLPFMGTFACDTAESGSRAALMGGTTTVLEMCCPSLSEEPWAGFRRWEEVTAGQWHCDYSYHLAVTHFGPQTEAQLRQAAEEGIHSLKIFLAYPELFGIQDDALYSTLQLAQELNLRVCAHCENATLITRLQQRCLQADQREPVAHGWSRPPIVEAEGVHHFLTFAELTGASVYVVHLSSQEALEAALRARQRGVDVAIEVLIQHLLLDESEMLRPGFEGAKYVMSPPLRDKRHQGVLWDALQRGEIQTVATDHAPFHFKTQKVLGKGDFTQIPNGIPAVEHRMALLYTYGVQERKMDLRRFVEVTSTAAAKLFGWFPKKGHLGVGSDADVVVYDPRVSGSISARTHHMNVDYSAFEGWSVQGRVDWVLLRGQVFVREGEWMGNRGGGEGVRLR